MATRKYFLEDKSHRIRFVYMPEHCSRLNRIEILFSRLNRRVLWHGDFDSVATLEAKIRRYTDFYNQNAKPMKMRCV
jgi:transposase